MQEIGDFKFFDDYDRAKRQWLSLQKRNFKRVEDDLSHMVPANKFIDQLEVLFMVTRDVRFKDAVIAMRDHKFICGRDWANKTPYKLVNGFEQKYVDAASRLIEILVEEGLTKRLAYANCAVHFRWPGNSFEAAVKALERLHQAGGRSEVEDIS